MKRALGLLVLAVGLPIVAAVEVLAWWDGWVLKYDADSDQI